MKSRSEEQRSFRDHQQAP